LNPDNALEMTNQKFISRFNYIEQRSKEMQKPMAEMTLQEMDQLWEEAKTVNVNPNPNLNVNGNGNLNVNLNPNPNVLETYGTSEQARANGNSKQ
jgi:XTP/dITP diphosphohydrolase